MAKRKLTTSAKLQALFDQPRVGPRKPVNRFDDQGRSLMPCDTRKQLKLFLAANRLLAKSGYFVTAEEKPENIVLDPLMIGVGGLRPLWHGRA